MDKYDVFCGWIEERGEKLSRWQAALAKTLLNLPVGSGKVWLLSRLLAHETSTTSQMFEIADLGDDVQDEQGRRRYTLGSVRGCPSMIPDKEGFWTPVNG